MENKKKRRGMLALLLGLALTVCGGALLTRSGGRLEYILPAPAATQEGGELNALYEEAQKQLASIADSVTASAVGARAQGLTLSTETQSAQTTVYAVGSGYFDVVHETLLDGRLISEADVKRAEDAIVIDESTALTFFAGDEPVGKTVTLNGLNYEVAGVVRTSRRLGEMDEHVAYIPITAASANALAMQTVELTAQTADKTTGSAILMENTLRTWQSSGSFYNYNKLALGAAMPIRWLVLFAGVALLLSLVSRLNAAAGQGVLLRRSTQDALCAGYDWRNDRKRAAGAAGLCGAGGRGVCAGKVFHRPAVCVYGVGAGSGGGAFFHRQTLLVAQRRERRGGALYQPKLLRAGNRARAAALGAFGPAAGRMDERRAVLRQTRADAGNQQRAIK